VIATIVAMPFLMDLTYPRAWALEEASIDGKSAESWLKDLSGKDYTQRKQAFQALWKLPPQDLQELFERESPSSPSEVAQRNWLILLQQLEASPESAAQLIDNLARLRSGDFETVIRLAKDHRWDELLSLLAVLTSEGRKQLQNKQADLSDFHIRLLTLAWNDSRQDIIHLLVDQLWDPTGAADARRTWKANSLIDLANSPMNTVDQLLQWELASQEDKAIAVAIETQQFSIAEDIAIRTARWDLIPTFADRLGSRSDRQALKAKPGSISSGVQAVEHAQEALLAHWSGRPENAEELLAGIGNPGLALTDVKGVVLSLAVGDRMDQALQIMEKRMPDEAFTIYWMQEKIVPALRIIGLINPDESKLADTKDPIDIKGVKAWLDKELAKKVDTFENDIDRTKRLAEVGSLLARLGKPDVAAIVDVATVENAASLLNKPRSKTDAIFRQNDSSPDNQNERWKIVIETWLRHHRRPLAIVQFHELLSIQKENTNLHAAILRELYPSVQFEKLSPIVVELFDAFKGLRNGDEVQAAKDLERFAWGLAPENWNSRWEQDGLQQVLRKMLPNSNRELVESDISVQLARLAIENSRYDFALQLVAARLPTRTVEKLQDWLSTKTSSFDLETLLTSNELRLPGVLDYLTILDLVYEAKGDYASRQAVLGLLEVVDPGLIHLVKRADCLDHLGEFESAKDLRQLAITIPLAPAATYKLWFELKKSQFCLEKAMFAKATSLSMSLSSPGYLVLSKLWFYSQQQLTDEDRERPLLDDAQRSQSSRDGLQAGRASLWNQLNEYPRETLELQNYLVTIERICRYEARLAIESDQWEIADAAVKKCWRANPDQIETLLELVPLARKQFGQEKADQWLELYTEPLETHLNMFPDDSLVGNNLAWLYANLDCRLEHAKELSTRVTKLLVDDHMYLDTLGEVELRLGNVQEAIAISTRCKQLAPRELHYQRQLARFNQPRQLRK